MSYAQSRLDDGADSFSLPSERKSRQRADKRLRAAEAKAAKALRSASDAMSELLYAYFEAHPDMPSRQDDGRRLLQDMMLEYASWLEIRAERAAQERTA